MSNNDFWNPIVCSSCGTIVGQIPSYDEYETLKLVGEIPTILERLDNIQTLLYDGSKNPS
jgi:DNA-directed RNA polymerase subunit N (RpoN/RPB10)